ncbi:ABC transporter substrate-binding protein [Stakelama tenebrarum]|uniref:ABC transporter substrate-binding protein n=1 Tax=Stakelama tenebrarum TaxID=2711215 RepID=UPI001D18DCF7|nr:ABC transporter substrate-binding protein [Sphingosinithalassobacter tenebrarum]
MVAAALLLSACTSQPAPTGGIVSTNPCADAILVELVPPRRIAAISHYSADPMASSIPAETAAQFRTTRGTAEEIIAMRPELVIASSFTAPSTRAAYARAGLDVLYLDSPATIAASEAQVRELAKAVDAPAAGEAMVQRIETAIASAATPDTQPVPALAWIGGNLVSGDGTLLHEMLGRAGFRDAAADYGLQFTGYLPAEHVIADPPRVMLVPDEPGRAATSRAAQIRARVLSRMGGRVVQAQFPRRLVNCGGPVIADAMTRLAQVRRNLM